jgi:tRNA threonylcarbamoyl adenosine modification protein YeaZ
MLGLILDTALDACAAAIARLDADGTVTILAEDTEIIGRGHAERLMDQVGRVLAAASIGYRDLGRIGVTVGPGSFTGIRVGLATARGLRLALRIPVVGLVNLDAAAADAVGAAAGRPILAAWDARRGEVYARLYAPSGTPLADPVAAPAATLAGTLSRPTLVTGSGAPLIAAETSLATVFASTHHAPIAALARLAMQASALGEPPRPLYLRPPDAKPQTQAGVARQ